MPRRLPSFPASILHEPSLTVVCIVVVYVLALLPTVIVAGVHRSRPVASPAESSPHAPSLPLLAGVVLMAIASAPTLLYVPLAAELHGRSSVALAAIAFTIGSLTAPYVAGVVERRAANGPVAWIVCAVGMVVLWPFAPFSIAVLCAAQMLSGQFMTTLEGLLDARAAAGSRPGHRRACPWHGGSGARLGGRDRGAAVRAGRRGAVGDHREA